MRITIRSTLSLALGLLVASTSVSASRSGLSYVLTNAKLSISTVDGSSRLSQTFTSHADYSSNAPPFDLSSPTQLENDDVIRLGFALAVQDGKKGSPSFAKEHVPHQAFVVLAEAGKSNVAQSVAQAAWPIQVKPSSGKATWNLRMDRIPARLLAAENPLTLSLLLSNFASSSADKGSYQPLSLPLLSLRLPTSMQAGAASPSPRDKAEIEQGFRGWPANRHTFGIPPDESMPSRQLSAAAALITAVVPWTILVALIATIQPSLTAPTPRISLLFASLVGLEILAFRYWIGMTLFSMLPFLLGGGMVTLIVGKSALGDLRKRRLQSSATK